MEINQYLILLLVIFSVDTLVLPSFAKNENESDLPKSPDLGDWWRSILVSDMANSEGQTIQWTDNFKSFAFLFAKVLFIGSIVFMYFHGSSDNTPRIFNILTICILGIMSLKYIAYAGWFDDKQCSNFYISSLKSDHVEDTIYKVVYLIFCIILAILLKYNPIRMNKTFTLLFIAGLPFVIYFVHWLFVRMMYMGCETGKGIFSLFDNECSISPATFYREYIFGKSGEETDSASKSWDFLRRGATVVLAFVYTFVMISRKVLPSHRLLPVTFIAVSAWVVFGIPFLLNWLTTIDLERKVANDETNSITIDDTKEKRNYRGWRCTMNKYGGISGYLIILCVQLLILRKYFTT